MSISLTHIERALEKADASDRSITIFFEFNYLGERFYLQKLESHMNVHVWEDDRLLYSIPNSDLNIEKVKALCDQYVVEKIHRGCMKRMRRSVNKAKTGLYGYSFWYGNEKFHIRAGAYVVLIKHTLVDYPNDIGVKYDSYTSMSHKYIGILTFENVKLACDHLIFKAVMDE